MQSDERGPLTIHRSNTILYCERWTETVEFYRSTIGLTVTFENDWFVEFAVAGTYVSIANTARATIAPNHGAGVTISWRVDDVATARAEIGRRGVDTSPITQRWGAATTFFHDPEGNRIELWSGSDAG